MSTRSIVRFKDDHGYSMGVYIHTDGYPSHRGHQVMEFLRVIRDEVQDSRMHEPWVLAARFTSYMIHDFHQRNLKKKATYNNLKGLDDHRLGPISVKLFHEDPGDIEFCYVVNCSSIGINKLPEVMCEDVWADETRPLQDVLETLRDER